MNLGTLSIDIIANAAGLVSAVQAASASLRVFGDLERQLNQINAVADLTAGQFGAIREAALELGASTAFSARQAAEGMSELSKAGLTAQQTLQAIPGVLDLAAAGGTSVARAAEVAAGALRGFGLAADQAGHVADLLAQTANSSAVDIADLGNSFKYIAPAASAAGQTMEEMSAALGILGNNMIKGEQAGTTLRGLLVRLTDPPKQAAEALAKMRISLVDTHGAMLPMRDIVEQLREKTARMTDAQRLKALADVAGTEAVSGLAAMVKTSVKDWEAAEKKIRDVDGASKDMASKMQQGLNPALERAGGAVETLGARVGAHLAPGVIAAAGAVEKLAGGLAALLGTVGKAVPAHENLAGANWKAMDAARGHLTELNKLASEHQTLTKKTALTTLEKQRLRTIMERLTEIAPSVVGGFDKQGRAILIYKDRIDKTNDSLWTAIQLNIKLAQAAEQAARQDLARAKIALSTDTAMANRLDKQIKVTPETRSVPRISGARGDFEVFEAGQRPRDVLQETRDVIARGLSDRRKVIADAQKVYDEARKDRRIKDGSILGKSIFQAFPDFDRMKPNRGAPVEDPAKTGGGSKASDAEKEAQRMAQAYAAMGEEMKRIDQLVGMLGDSYDDFTARQSAARSSIDNLLRAGFSPMSAQVQEAVATYKEASDAVDGFNQAVVRARQQADEEIASVQAEIAALKRSNTERIATRHAIRDHERAQLQLNMALQLSAAGADKVEVLRSKWDEARGALEKLRGMPGQHAAEMARLNEEVRRHGAAWGVAAKAQIDAKASTDGVRAAMDSLSSGALQALTTGARQLGGEFGAVAGVLVGAVGPVQAYASAVSKAAQEARALQVAQAAAAATPGIPQLADASKAAMERYKGATDGVTAAMGALGGVAGGALGVAVDLLGRAFQEAERFRKVLTATDEVARQLVRGIAELRMREALGDAVGGEDYARLLEAQKESQFKAIADLREERRKAAGLIIGDFDAADLPAANATQRQIDEKIAAAQARIQQYNRELSVMRGTRDYMAAQAQDVPTAVGAGYQGLASILEGAAAATAALAEQQDRAAASAGRQGSTLAELAASVEADGMAMRAVLSGYAADYGRQAAEAASASAEAYAAEFRRRVESFSSPISSSISGAIQAALNSATLDFSSFELQLLQGMRSAVVNAVSEAFSASLIMPRLQPLLEQIAGAFDYIGKASSDANRAARMQDALGLLPGLGGEAKRMLQDYAPLISGARDTINAAFGSPTSAAGASASSSGALDANRLFPTSINGLLPALARLDIPAFGDGGIVSRPTLAVVGEAGPEAIVPLRGRRGGDGASVGGGGGSFSPQIVIHYSGTGDPEDARELARRLAPELAREYQKLGLVR